MKTSYRDRIYECYASVFQDASDKFEVAAANRWGQAYDWYFRGWMPERKDAAILEVACGSGRLLHFFKKRGYSNVKGVDISPGQVYLAREVTEDVVEGDVLEFLDGVTETYDLIVGLDIIEHFHKDEAMQFLDGCYRRLKPGGRIILQTPNADSPWGTYHRYNDFTHEICFQHNSLSRLLRLCGFEAVELRELAPVPWGYSLKSTIRYVIWQGIRMGLKIYNLVETGRTGSGVFTRVFLASALKG